ncbi:hypothetical protein D2E23_1158 [Bifidobacterium callimiconis]|uniref:Uncharacterized protein n=1 Tax=Bifidobacterium callimiconis TaxID=2306973 RepID=A0A430FDG8_9BIFI|nr:hypothetical protein D2E23_1158 [Bifidobacterium callimiconis]
MTKVMTEGGIDYLCGRAFPPSVTLCVPAPSLGGSTQMRKDVYLASMSTMWYCSAISLRFFGSP